jgi:hypothetical protein
VTLVVDDPANVTNTSPTPNVLVPGAIVALIAGT